jgi:acyl-CoA reductase-like NAD-dependent aldehyde dehydrogenase
MPAGPTSYLASRGPKKMACTSSFSTSLSACALALALGTAAAYSSASMAAGCTFIYKGSEKSPIGLLQIGDLIKEAGFPPGVINIVNGDGKVGAALASHMDINKISFTGSAFAGKKVQELAAKR